jgi:propanol-preferring alcohol dehydrogenase
MRAMVLPSPGSPLELRELADPSPAAGQLLVRVSACGVCRTDLHIADGELVPKPGALPVVLGHQVVGEVIAVGAGCRRFAPGRRVGIAWLAWACGECPYCLGGQENLCERARFTGFDHPGGFAELTVVDERFAYAVPDAFNDTEAAPLLCGGAIGYRSLRMCGPQASRLGLYGFGSAAHMILQLLVQQGREAAVFTRPGDAAAQEAARRMGAAWAGGSDAMPPAELDAAILFAPVGALVPAALRAVRKGGIVVCGGIHMSDIPSFPYSLLWGERSVRSVANLTRRDAEEFLQLAAAVPIRPQVTAYALEEADSALVDLREGRAAGSLVLRVR